MAKSEVLVEIDEYGKVQLEVKGVVGPSCNALTRGLESDLGTVETRTPKAPEKTVSNRNQVNA